MKHINLLNIKSRILVLLIIVLSGTSCKNETMMNYPVARKVPKELIIHGDTRLDNYYWMRERENPEVIKYLEQENAYFETEMSDTKTLREKLYNEIIGRIKQTDISVPYKYKGYYYYTRYEEDREYPIYCRKKSSLDRKEEIMVNVNDLAAGYSYYHLVGMSVSPDNKIISYGVDTFSRRIYLIYFKNLVTGETYKDILPANTGSAAWAADNKTVFYTRKDENTLRPYQVYRHVLGTDVSTDRLIFEENDETYSCGVYSTKSRKYILISSYAKLSTEYRFLESSNPRGKFKLIAQREKNLEYEVSQYDDKFYIVTNLDAKNFRLMEMPVSMTGKENWKEIIPHRDDVLLEDVEIFKNYLVVSERKDGLTQLRIINWKDMRTGYYLDFGEEDYMAYVSINPDFDSKLLRYGYTSLTTPNSVIDYDMETHEKKLLKQQEVIGEFKSSDYEAKRLYVRADDDTKIPLSMVYRKGIQKNGKNPLLLYGYGSYGITMDPSFSSIRLSLLDRGFIFVIAHIRGEQIYGRQWYDDGKLLKKMNTFTDFNSCAEYLINEKYTSSGHLYAMGGSAGGLLMGAVINMKPELYHGVIAAVPFVDVVTTMLDKTIPLTTAEYDEWGNPNNKIYYDNMMKYSPYDNVRAHDYPNMLVTAGLHDSQVQYWEPAKWVAKLRDMKTDNNLLLLYTNM